MIPPKERPVQHETLEYEADGLSMRSRLMFESGADRRPAVLVFPEAFGLGEASIDRAERLAALGYVALACDLHGGARYVDDLQEAMGLLAPLFADPQRTRARASAALTALLARPEVDPHRVAAIGFCFPAPLELARSGADLKLVAGFHTGLTTNGPPTEVGAIKGRVLVFIGADDPMIHTEHRLHFEDEMRTTGADWEMQVFGRTVHSFTSRDAAKRNLPDAVRYSAQADARSWKSLVDALAEAFSKGQHSDGG